MTPLFGYDPRRGHFTQTLVHIDARDLAFKQEGGWRQAVFEIMAVTFGDSGRVVDQDDRPYTVRLPESDFQRAAEAGLVYTVTLPIKKPGAYQLRLAVRDTATGKVGSVNQFIEVPDVKKGRLTLSGVTLRGLSAAEAGLQKASAGGPAAAAAPDASAGQAVRRFRRGAALGYAFYVYNARPDKATGRPQLEVQMRLFRDGRLVYATRSGALNAGEQADPKQLVGGGSFRPGLDLPPGEYALQVVVTDRLAKDARHATATQWTDFELLP